MPTKRESLPPASKHPKACANRKYLAQQPCCQVQGMKGRLEEFEKALSKPLGTFGQWAKLRAQLTMKYSHIARRGICSLKISNPATRRRRAEAPRHLGWVRMARAVHFGSKGGGCTRLCRKMHVITGARKCLLDPGRYLGTSCWVLTAGHQTSPFINALPLSLPKRATRARQSRPHHNPCTSSQLLPATRTIHYLRIMCFGLCAGTVQTH